ncbi:formyltransferase family protein [Hymenobacter baengnokdamensis]|uniref:formyltransferase family protein n=1 Tax=Hymenobacter baengnokdamensis TaxID=2615203 RepID=UPI0012482F6C|nr:formyltransferase family protein [Hymenobacter baengnokdamensis]
MSPSKVTLYLMTEKGYRVLEHIVRHLDTSLIAQVVSARDKNLARDYYDEIVALCHEAGIACISRLAARPVASSLALAISWRWLINEPNSTLVVLHDSLLPRYRGFAPLVNYLINGEPEIGVTALYADRDFDRGDIIAQARRSVVYPLTIATAIETVSECYIELVSQLWQSMAAAGRLAAEPQKETLATYSLWRDDEDYRLDWQLDASRLRRTVDALGWPYKGAAVLLDGVLLRVLRVEELPDVIIENRAPGKVLFSDAQGPVVVCGHGLLRLLEVVTEQGQSALPLPKFRVRFC